jgi:putative oxidoreductase
MNWITKIEGWGNSHRPGFLDYVRIVLGAFITYKGAMFAQNIEQLEAQAQGLHLDFMGIMIAHYVIFAHLLGGPLLLLGLFTRIMCFIQVPILMGAVLVNAEDGLVLAAGHLEFEVSLAVLLGLVMFMVFGAGKLSIDEKRRQDNARLNAQTH